MPGGTKVDQGVLDRVGAVMWPRSNYCGPDRTGSFGLVDCLDWIGPEFSARLLFWTGLDRRIPEYIRRAGTEPRTVNLNHWNWNRQTGKAETELEL